MAAVTRSRHVVRGPVVVVVVVGMSRSIASGGKIVAMPSIVHVVSRPKTMSGTVGLARQPSRMRTRIREPRAILPSVAPR